MKSNSKLSEFFNRIQLIACINNPRYSRSQCDSTRNLDIDVYHLELFVNKLSSNIENFVKESLDNVNFDQTLESLILDEISKD